MAWTTPVTQTTGTLITAAIWNAQVTDNMTYLKTMDMTGMIVIRDTDCPAGWTRVSALDNKFVRGSATYNASAGGSDTHSHSHVHSSPVHVHAQNEGSNLTSRVATTTYVVKDASKSNGMLTDPGTGGSSSFPAMISGVQNNSADNTGTDATAGSTLPAYASVIFCKKN